MGSKRARFDLHFRLAVFRRDAYRCQHCGFRGTFFELQLDHVIPWSWGGPDDYDNFQTLCRACNRRKGNRYIG